MAPNLAILKKISKENLSRSLRLLRGKKILVIDSKITPTLDLIVNFQFLKDHGVEKVLHLDSLNKGGPRPTDAVNQCLYIIRSDLISAKLICDQINSNINSNLQMTYGVIVVPRLLHVIKDLFESEGVFGHVILGQYSHELIPLDDHILSLQYDDILQQLRLHSDTSLLPAVAKCLFNLQGIYGDFYHLIALGENSKTVVKMMSEFERLYSYELKNGSGRQVSDLPTVIIVDRSLDFVSSLLTPLTYEGILDEIFGIKGKTIVFGPEVTGGKETVKHVLSSSDYIFESVRKRHFSKVIPKLVAHANELKNKKENSSGLNVKGIRTFVEKELNEIKLSQKNLTLHFGALDLIIRERSSELKNQVDHEEKIIENSGQKDVLNYLEDSMARGFDQNTILRLFCLSSLAQDGLRDYNSLKTQFIQSYGFQSLITLHNLETMGLLYPYGGIEVNVKGVAQVINRVAKSANAALNSSPSNATISQFSGSGSKDAKKVNVPFQTVLKKLVPPANLDINIECPNHPSYIFNGSFTPFVAKITDEILSVLVQPKTNVQIIEKKLEELMKFYHVTENVVKCKQTNTDPFLSGRNVLVFMIGGITRGEIAALQLVGEEKLFNIISGGTNMTNGKKLVQSAYAL